MFDFEFRCYFEIFDPYIYHHFDVLAVHYIFPYDSCYWLDFDTLFQSSNIKRSLCQVAYHNSEYTYFIGAQELLSFSILF